MRFDPRQLVRREGEDYPAPGTPAVDSECRGDPILQHLQSITVELDADSPEGRRLLSTAPVPRVLDSEGDSVDVELLHQEPCVVLDPESAAEDLRPAIVARRLWEAAEVLPSGVSHGRALYGEEMDFAAGGVLRVAGGGEAQMGRSGTQPSA